MVMYLLTLTGILSILLMVRAASDSRITLFVFGFLSFLITIILTNGVS